METSKRTGLKAIFHEYCSIFEKIVIIRFLKIKPDILRKAKIEGALWTEAQIKEPSIRVFLELHRDQILNDANWCYIDGACKEQYIFTGQGWFYRKKGSTDTMIGVVNIRRSL